MSKPVKKKIEGGVALTAEGLKENLELLGKLSGCRVCGCVPINNQGRCAEHQEPGDTIGPVVMLPPKSNKMFVTYMSVNTPPKTLLEESEDK